MTRTPYNNRWHRTAFQDRPYRSTSMQTRYLNQMRGLKAVRRKKQYYEWIKQIEGVRNA